MLRGQAEEPLGSRVMIGAVLLVLRAPSTSALASFYESPSSPPRPEGVVARARPFTNEPSSEAGMKLLALVLAWDRVGARAGAGNAASSPRQQSPPPRRGAAGHGRPARVGLLRLTHLGEDEATFQKNIREPHLCSTRAERHAADAANTMRGSYTVKTHAVVRSLMGTLWPAEPPDKLDSRFKEALGNTKKWKATATELTLLDDKDAVVARFEAVPR